MDKNQPEREPLLPQIKQAEAAALSLLQQEFNRSIQKIDQLKADLAERIRMLDEARARVQKEIKPLTDALVQKRIEFVKLLDQIYQEETFQKKEKEKIAQLIQHLATSLLYSFGREEMREFVDRYSPENLDPDIADAKEATQQLLQNMLGLDVDLEDLEGFGSLQEKLEEQMRQEQEKREGQQKNRQKSKTQSAKADKAKTELQNIGKATRRLYTSLAKLLHPDKELDPEVKIWKEEAIKLVTLAYHQDDFFELLRLQMEFMHEQERHLNQVPEDQLHYYLKLLSQQIAELEEEQSNYYLGPQAQLFEQFGGTPKQMEIKFRRAKKEIKYATEQLRQDIADFQDPEYLRAYLKHLTF